MSGLTMKALQEQINKLNEEVSILKSNVKPCVFRKNLGIGDTFELAGLTWKILDITEKAYMCLADRLDGNRQFDADTNNWSKSSLRKYLNGEFLNKLKEEIGEENILSFERGLLSLDGLDDYGKCEDYVSLLNLDEYRKYRKLIPNTEYWWWLLTADSTESNGDSTWVLVVSPSGDVFYYNCKSSRGVRPVCIFSSSIFES